MSDPVKTDRQIAAENQAFFLAVKEARVRHAFEIDQIERHINQHLCGDAQVGEIVAIMAARGWCPPKGGAA